jgi:NDP-sugar pyrophosphorylase family protein
MRGLPKFLLPVGEKGETLLEYHVKLLAPHVDYVIVPTRTEWFGLLSGFDLGVQLLEHNTDTLAETVLTSLQEVDYDACILGLPDTVFRAGNPYQSFGEFDEKEPLVLGCFPTQEQQQGKLGAVEIADDGTVIQHADKSDGPEWGTHWGTMRFTPETLRLLAPTAKTVGTLIDECLSRGIPVRGFRFDSEYFDCGTFSEYVACLTQVVGDSLND